MAVVKANFAKRGRGAKGRAKATLRYMQHRPGKDKEPRTHKLFGVDGVLDRLEVYRLVDDAVDGTIFYRIVISPDPMREETRKDLDLWAITAHAMEILEEKLKQRYGLPDGLQWVAVEHDDHTPHRHLHTLVLSPGKLTREDFAAFRQAATRAALAQRFERDLAVEPQHQQEQHPALPSTQGQQGAFFLQTGDDWQPQAKPLTTLIPTNLSHLWRTPGGFAGGSRPMSHVRRPSLAIGTRTRRRGGRMGVMRLVAHLLVILSRFRSSLSKSQQLHTATFAGLHEITSLLSTKLDEISLLLGMNRFSQLLRVRPTPKRRELGNLLIVAPTRGGKGLLAVSQLLTWPHSVIVNDIKGELFAATAGYRRTLGKVFVLDPTGIGHRYDPLLGKHTEDALFSSATHLLFKADEGDGAIFTQRATVMLTQLFLAARLEGSFPVPYVRHLLRSGLLGAARRLHTLSPELATQFLDVAFSEANFSDRFLLSAWGTLSARLRPLLTETVVRSLAGADFTLWELMRSAQPVTVYLRWPEQDLLALSPLVRLLWGSFIDELVTTYDRSQGTDCRPVLLLIDEAGRTAIPSLADHATTVVGRGISLWIAIQSLSQLDTVYGRTRANTLRDNMESQIYYRPSNQETADYLERCLGKRSAFAQSHTLHAGTQTAEGLSEQGVPLLTAQEIKQLGDEEIIGFHRRLPPFRARRMDWREFPLLAKRRRLPLPPLPVLPALAETLPLLVGQGRGEFANEYIDPDS